MLLVERKNVVKRSLIKPESPNWLYNFAAQLVLYKCAVQRGNVFWCGLLIGANVFHDAAEVGFARIKHSPTGGGGQRLHFIDIGIAV